jgi:membrane-bound metal-dependent hydrolase YbcI (DUF457 family)
MCLGHTHALSGAATGAAVGLFILHTRTSGTADLALLSAGFAVVPDIDKCGATVSRSFGFLTESFAWLVGRISGGHRHGTHSLIGIGVFTGLTFLACKYRADWPGRVGLMLLLAIGFAAGLRALRIGGHFADALALAAAAYICWKGWNLTLIPIAAAAGTATHIVGDMLTIEGCPLLWPFTLAHFKILPRPFSFRTGTWREHIVLVPLLFVALAWLAYRVALTGHYITAELNNSTEPAASPKHPRSTGVPPLTLRVSLHANPSVLCPICRNLATICHVKTGSHARTRGG